MLLADQDRSIWDRALIAKGQAIVRRCLERNRPGQYEIQAAINAVHSDAATSAETDWSQVLALYDQLFAIAPSAVVALNRVVALVELEGPEPALAAVDDLDLATYSLFHATRADLLARLGHTAGADRAYKQAVERTNNHAEIALLEKKRSALPR